MGLRSKGSNALMSVELYNSCFESYFGVCYASYVHYSLKASDVHLIYYLGLRRVCGLSYRDMSKLLGFSSFFECPRMVNLEIKMACVYDVLYSEDFVQSWRSFVSYCRLFRKPLSGAERSKRFRDNQRNKKKRAKVKSKK